MSRLAFVLTLAACDRAAAPTATPHRQVVLAISGLGATGPVESWYRFDPTSRVLLVYNGPFGIDEASKARRYALTSADSDRLWQHAAATLRAGKPATQHVTDYLLHLTITDGSQVLDVTGDGPLAGPQAEGLYNDLVRLSR